LLFVYLLPVYGKKMPCNEAEIRQALTEAFREVDKDKSGHISASELQVVLESYYKSSGQKGNAAKDAQDFLKEVDKGGDNQVSLDEFINFFLQLCKG